MPKIIEPLYLFPMFGKPAQLRTFQITPGCWWRAFENLIVKRRQVSWIAVLVREGCHFRAGKIWEGLETEELGVGGGCRGEQRCLKTHRFLLIGWLLATLSTQHCQTVCT